MNPVFRLFSYLYRPLPNETQGFEQFAASIDNMILVLLTAVGVTAVLRAGVIRVFRNDAIALLYGLAVAVLLSQVTANLGLAMRQKWMLFPALMLVFVGAWSAMKQEAESSRLKIRRLAGAPQAVR